MAQTLTELRKRAQGEDHWQAVDARHRVAALRQVLKQDAAVRKEYARIAALHSLAGNLYAQGKYAQSEEGYRTVLAVCLKVLGEDHPDTADSYHGLALNQKAQASYAQAEEGCRKALAIRRKVLGEDHPSTAYSYNNLAALHGAQGKYALAEEGYRKALAVRLEVLGEDHPETAHGYSNLAVNQYDQGKYAQAEEGLRQALAIKRKLLGEDHPDTAYGYNNIAAIQNAQGKYALAEEGYRKALVLFRKLLGEDHPNTASAYNNLAYNQHAQGKFAQAEEGCRKALAIRRKLLGEDHPHTAASYNNLAALQHEQGKYEQAEEGYRKALAVRRKVLGEDHPYTAAAYIILAQNQQAQGKYEQAEEGCRKALAIDRKRLGEDHPQTALAYDVLASCQQAQGNDVQAGEGFRKALAIRRKALGEDHPLTATSFHHLALNQYAQGKYDRAENDWQQAADRLEKARGRIAASGLDRAFWSGALSPLPHLAAVLARNGKRSAAWQRFEQSLGRGTWDDLSARLRRPLAERNKQAELVVRLNRLDQLVERTFATGAPTANLLEQRKQLLTQQRQAQDELNAFTAAMGKRYGPVGGQIFDRAAIQAALPRDAALVGWIDLPGEPKGKAPNGEHWAVLLRSAGDPVFVPLPRTGAAATWSDADAGLPAESAHCPAKRPRQVAAAGRAAPQAASGAAGEAFGGGEGPARGAPSDRAALVCPGWRACGGVRRGLQHQLRPVGHPVHPSPPAKGARVAGPAGPGGPRLRPSRRLCGRTAAASRRRAADCGNARLQRRPLGPAPNDVLLRYAGKNLATPADLQTASTAPGKESVPVHIWRDGKTFERRLQPGKLGVVVASDPAPKALAEQRRLDRRLASRGGDEDHWTQLPGTRAEVEALRRLFGKAPALKLLFDSDASEQGLYTLAEKHELAQYRYLHLATHGKVDNRLPLRSGVILSRDHLPNPGKQLDAGLPIFDGRLTAQKVLENWQLDSDLVTLSACQTALGQYLGGEGYVGFAQALLLSGSRGVCLSLWKVDDAATALLMERFYQNLLGKREGLKAPLPKGLALAEAKAWLRQLPREQAVQRMALLSKGVARGKGRKVQPLLPGISTAEGTKDSDRPYAHPYYWAAFVLIGDER